jgi:hypothetical protein
MKKRRITSSRSLFIHVISCKIFSTHEKGNMMKKLSFILILIFLMSMALSAQNKPEKAAKGMKAKAEAVREKAQQRRQERAVIAQEKLASARSKSSQNQVEQNQAEKEESIDAAKADSKNSKKPTEDFKHAKRLAQIARLKEIALENDNSVLLEKVERLIELENKRYNKMQSQKNTEKATETGTGTEL